MRKRSRSRYNRLTRVLTVTLVGTLLVITMVSTFGYMIDRPILVSYARSGSMEPTIRKGDLFLINPLSKGNVGDVIVFWNGEGWTVHRIYAVTDEGYVTKGDANVATDQSGGAGIVRREDVAGKVLTLEGRVLKLPGIGGYVSSLGEWRTILIVAVMFLGGLLILWGDGGESKFRKLKRSRKTARITLSIPLRSLYWAVSLVLIALFVSAIVTSWGTFSLSYSSTMAGGQRDGWYTPGSSFNESIKVRNNAFYPFYYIAEGTSEDVEGVEPEVLKVDGRSEGTFKVSVKVPLERRVYTSKVDLHTYPAFLPFRYSTLASLYSISPYLPIVPYALVLFLFLLVLYVLLGIGKVTLRVRVSRRSVGGRVLSLIGV